RLLRSPAERTPGTTGLYNISPGCLRPRFRTSFFLNTLARRFSLETEPACFQLLLSCFATKFHVLTSTVRVEVHASGEQVPKRAVRRDHAHADPLWLRPGHGFLERHHRRWVMLHP